jgi:2-desacetyl-2-hydroxyethyl bacteriochlorophyllide A dehydrogenase
MGEHLAAMLTERGSIGLHRVSTPRIGPLDVLVRVLATGICGSDLATYRGSHPYKRPPVVLGHELCGVVKQVGAEVADLRPGALVCSAAFSPCDSCAQCARGATNLCPDRENLCHLGWDGSFAELVVLRRNMVFELPDGIDPEVGAMAEPLSIAAHAARLAGPLAGRSVAVIGAGGIGLCCALVARRHGAASVVCTDLGSAKEELTRHAGATAYVDGLEGGPRDGVLAALPDGADVTFVASGHTGALDQAAGVTALGGTVVVVSYFDRPHEFSANPLVSAELSVRFSALSTAEDFREVIGWLAKGELDPTPLISHRYQLAEAAAAMEALATQRGVGKVMMRCDGGAPERSTA